MFGVLRARRWQLGLAVLAGALLVVVAVVLLRDDPEPAPRERRYADRTACLLTDDRGVTGGQAKAAWDGMQRASLATRVKVQYLAVTGDPTVANASAFLNTLGLQKCDLVVAVGKPQVEAVREAVDRFPGTRYVVIGGASIERVTSVTSTDLAAITSATDAEVSRLVGPNGG